MIKSRFKRMSKWNKYFVLYFGCYCSRKESLPEDLTWKKQSRISLLSHGSLLEIITIKLLTILSHNYWFPSFCDNSLIAIHLYYDKNISCNNLIVYEIIISKNHTFFVKITINVHFVAYLETRWLSATNYRSR